MVGERVEDAAGGVQAGDLFVGEEVIDRLGVPEVAVGKVGGGEVAGAGLVELGDDLVAVVDVPGLGGGATILTGNKDGFADPAVGVVVDVGDGFGRLAGNKLSKIGCLHSLISDVPFSFPKDRSRLVLTDQRSS